jgi:hypothetical protein
MAGHDAHVAEKPDALEEDRIVGNRLAEKTKTETTLSAKLLEEVQHIAMLTADERRKAFLGVRLEQADIIRPDVGTSFPVDDGLNVALAGGAHDNPVAMKPENDVSDTVHDGRAELAIRGVGSVWTPDIFIH